MVGMLINGSADVGVTDFSITQERLNVVTFSTFFKTSPFVLILRSPSIINVDFLLPLSLQVWYCRLISYLTIVVNISVIIIVLCTKQNITKIVDDVALMMFGSQFSQPVLLNKKYRCLSVNILTSVWVAMTVFTTCLYNSNMKAIYSVTTQSKRAESLQEALENPNFQVMLFKDSLLRALLQNGTGDFEKAWKRSGKYKNNFLTYPDDLQMALDKVKIDQNYGLMITLTTYKEFVEAKKQFQELYMAKKHIISGKNLTYIFNFVLNLFDILPPKKRHNLTN